MPSNTKRILGIDVGGTKIAAGLVNHKFEVTNVSTFPTSQTNLKNQLELLIRSYTYNGFDGIGLGMPGQVLSNGLVTKLPNVKNFKDINIKDRFEKKYKAPVNVMNDAKAFALAEAVIGAGRNFQSIVGVTLGTGVGMGFVLHGKLYNGADGIAAELGQLSIAVDKALELRIKDNPQKHLKLLASLIALSFNPQAIVLGGGWSNLVQVKEILKKALTELVFPTKTKVLVSKLKHAGLIGAALPLLKRQA